MGLLGNALASGIAAGANTAAEGFMAQFKSQVEQDRQEALVHAQEESQKRMIDYKVGVDDQQRAKVGGLLSSAGEGLDNERDILNARIEAADKAGYTAESDKMRNRLNTMDNIDRQDRMNDWQMKHGDAQLKAQEKHYRALESQAASALNLKKQERQDLSDAMDAYTVADGNLRMLDKTADEKTLKAAMMARDAAAMRLAPYGIKMGGDGKGKFHFATMEDSATGEKGVMIGDENTGAATYKTASELKGGGNGGNSLNTLFPERKSPQTPAKPGSQSADSGGGLLAPSARQSKTDNEPKIELLSKFGNDGWNVKVDGKYTSMTTAELKKRGIYPDLKPTQLPF